MQKGSLQPAQKPHTLVGLQKLAQQALATQAGMGLSFRSRPRYLMLLVRLDKVPLRSICRLPPVLPRRPTLESFQCLAVTNGLPHSPQALKMRMGLEA